MADEKENKEVAKVQEDTRVVQINVAAGFRLLAVTTNGARVDMARSELSALELRTVGAILINTADQLMAQASRPVPQAPAEAPPPDLKLAGAEEAPT